MRWASAVYPLLLVCGCDKSIELPSVEVRSPHFRYFATTADRIPNGILERLEQLRSDVYAYFGLASDKVILYYRFDRIEDFNFLDNSVTTEGLNIGASVYTTMPFDQHETIHAFLSDWPAAPIVAEGTAEALHCDVPPSWVFEAPAPRSWVDLVTKNHHDSDVYRWGVRLVLQLIRTYGPKRLLAYYQVSRGSSDPATFAEQFEGFWGAPLDSVWASLAADLSLPLGPICPCGQPVVPSDGTEIAISEFSDYRVIPSGSFDGTILLKFTGPGAGLGRCAVATIHPLSVGASGGSSDRMVAALRLDDDGYFVSSTGAASVSASSGSIIGADCQTAGTLAIPNGMASFALVRSPSSNSQPSFVRLDQPGSRGIVRVDGNPVEVGWYSDCSLTRYEPVLSGGAIPQGALATFAPSISAVSDSPAVALFSISP